MAEGEGMSEDAERGDLGEWCSKHREWTHPDAPCWGCQKEAGAIAKVERLEARVRELEAVVNAARAEAMLHFEESHRWRQQAQVVDDGLCMAKERIAELEGELGLLLEYFEQGVPYWHGTSPKDRIRAVLKGDADDANVH